MSTDFVIRDDVPVLDEHKLHDDAGNVIAVIDSTKLEKIAANNNRKIEETGDEVPLILGHTRDGDPEHEQPEIVGYADQFRVGWLEKLKRKALFARFKFFKDRAKDVLRRYPRRSVELWLRKLEIDPISLLGATTPERSLGLLRYSSDGMHYSRTLGTPPMEPQSNDVVSQVMAALEQTDVWQFMKQLMEQSQQPESPEMGGEGDMGGEGAPQDQYPGEFDEDNEPRDQGDEPTDAEMNKKDYCAYDSPSTREGMSRVHPAKYDGTPDRLPNRDRYQADNVNDAEQYEASSASATNTFPRGSFSVNKPGHHLSRNNPHKQANGMYDPKYKMQAQRDQARLRSHTLEDEKVRLARRVQELEKRVRYSARERDLIQLEAEGVMFDRAEELETAVSMNDAAWGKQMDRIRKRYQRAPLEDAGELIRFSRTDVASRKGTTREQMQEAVNLATRKGLDYEDARNSLNSEATKVF